MTQLDPRISEFESTEAAASYERWLLAKVETAKAARLEPIPHDQVMARIRATIAEAGYNQKLA